MAAIFCSYCNFTCRDDQQTQFISHLFKNHSNEPNFHVYCSHSNCTRSFTKVKSLQKHWQRDHAGIDDHNLNENGFEPEANDEQNPNDLIFDEQYTGIPLQERAAKFLLASKVEGNITQTALESVKESTQSLLAGYLQDLRGILENKLRENNPEFELDEELKGLFQETRVFQGLETEYNQNQYYLDNSNLVVS